MYSLSLLFIELIIQIVVMYYILNIKNENLENTLFVYFALKIITSFLLPRVFGYNILTIRDDLLKILNRNNKYLALSFFGIFIFVIMSFIIPFMIADKHGLIGILSKIGIDSIFRSFYFI